tara:strand:- start:49 stop:390 length:342 start_codon:yes stop_codon:yes gene_type:complete
MNNIDYTEIERPVEPAFANEDPEGWMEVLAWEEARADKLEQENKQLIETGHKANKDLRNDVNRLEQQNAELMWFVSSVKFTMEKTKNHHPLPGGHDCEMLRQQISIANELLNK